jgi:hypothetical protein
MNYFRIKDLIYRKSPLLVPGEVSFSNANIVALDQFIAETKTNLNLSFCPLLNTVFCKIVRHSIIRKFEFENWPTPGNKCGAYR